MWDICNQCSGSGEYMYDGSTCPVCKGNGELYYPADSVEDNDEGGEE